MICFALFNDAAAHMASAQSGDTEAEVELEKNRGQPGNAQVFLCFVCFSLLFVFYCFFRWLLSRQGFYPNIPQDTAGGRKNPPPAPQIFGQVVDQIFGQMFAHIFGRFFTRDGK